MEVASGGATSCAREASGAVWCWGGGDKGQLGSGDSDSATPKRVPLESMGKVTQLSLGAQHGCALHEDGQVSCWGTVPPSTTATAPTAIKGLKNIAQIAAGDSFSCARSNHKGRVYCWGRNKKHQLADGSSINRAAPAAIPALYYASTISAGHRHGCLIVRETVECFGANGFGQVEPIIAPSPSRRKTARAPKALLVATGKEHSCVAKAGGVSCWGNNAKGALGVSDLAVRDVVKARDKTLSTVVQLVAGAEHSCLRDEAGALSCWGDNARGQLGVKGAQEPGKWRQVPITGAKGISAGEAHSCAIDVRGHVHCWGDNTHGQLGQGKTSDEPQHEPLAVVFSSSK